MLKKLRRRLTIIFTCFTGAVLLAVLAVSMWYAVQNARLNGQISFSYQLDNVISQLVANADSGGIDPANAMLKVDKPFLVSVHVDGKPLGTSQSWAPPTSSDVLFDETRQQAHDRGLTNWAAEYAFTNEYAYAFPSEEDMAIAQEAAPLLPSQSFVLQGVPAVDAAETEMAAGAAETPGEAAGAAETPGEATEAAEASEEATEAADAETFYSGLEAGDDMLAITVSPMPMLAPDEGTFTLQGSQNEDYRASFFVMELPVDEDGNFVECEVALLESLEMENQHVLLLYVGYSALGLAGLALLAFINWQLARLVLKPTAQGMQRQADFVAAASHELRSPLAVVRSSLSAAQAADGEDTLRYQKAAEAEAVRMSRLVDDLLLLAGGDAGTWKLQNTHVDADTLLIDTAEQFTPLAQKAGLTLTLTLPDDTLPTLRGDSDRLRQILAVLLDNALQYAPKDSTVTLSATARKSRVRIEVADHGPGIPEAERERVFERFYRSDKSRGDKKHFGLGLSVARELAELHGGRLSVRETPGGGSTFRLELPAHRQNDDGKLPQG